MKSDDSARPISRSPWLKVSRPTLGRSRCASRRSMSSLNPESFRLQPRDCIAAMEEYSGPVDVDALAERLGLPVQDIAKLDGNENPYGPSPRVARALASGDTYQYYYDADQTELRR